MLRRQSLSTLLLSTTVFLLLHGQLPFAQGQPGPAGAPTYKQANRPIDERVADLLARMTLEEKAAQMLCVWKEKAQKLVDGNGNFDLEKARRSFADGHGLGQVGRPSDAGTGKNAHDMAVLTNAIQKFFVEESRLGIPVIFHEECLHGHKAIDATSFPQPIGLAGTFDTDLVRRVFTLTAAEARARHQPGADARGRRGPRSPLGPRRGDLW